MQPGMRTRPHLVTCAGMSRHRIVTDRFHCGECWAKLIMTQREEPTEVVRNYATRASLLELSVGASGTHRGYAHYAALESEWAAQMSGGRVSAVTLPRHSRQAFVMFCEWLTSDADRARSFSTIVRSAGGLAVLNGDTDWTRDNGVKAVFARLERERGIDAEPCTHATTRQLRLMFAESIQAVTASELLRRRVETQTVFEAVGGLRVGEALGADGGHGFYANDAAIQLDASRLPPLDLTVEVKVGSSKTGLGRTVCFVGRTGSTELQTADILRQYWQTWNIHTTTVNDGGFVIERPDYWVLRVSLVDMGLEEQQRLEERLRTSAVEEVRQHAAVSKKYMGALRRARTLDPCRRFVNISGGALQSEAVQGALSWLREEGFGRWGNVVKGPMFRAMADPRHGSHMPLQVDSCYKDMVAALKLAGEATIRLHEAGDVDPELERDAISEGYHWSSHSLRRRADKVARNTQRLLVAAGVAHPTELIDYFFG